jgi:arylformamidase
MRIISPALYLLMSFFLIGCSVQKIENVSYLQTTLKSISKPSLNIFTPKKISSKNNPVLVFVHGGNWNSGNKELYDFYGKNFAKKGITTVIVGYTLSPEADYKEMATQVAEAIKWIQKNIAEYKGDPEKLFLTGHSAGGHLVALAVMNEEYEIEPLLFLE